MRPILTAALAALALAVAPAGAIAATTANFAFTHGEANYRTSAATTPGAYQEGVAPRQQCPASGVPCTYEAHEFEIKPGEDNGSFAVSITWGSADDDWDLFVYRVRPDGTVDESAAVAKSAQGGTTEETALLRASPDTPLEPGVYRIYVDNWAAANPEWEGYVAFEPFIPGNKLPVALLTAPAEATAGETVTLDASGSIDSDGTIDNYSWDLDGNGSFEHDSETSPRVERAFDAGRAHVTVRVRDSKGALDYATKTITVAAPRGRPGEVMVPPPPGSITFDVRRRQTLSRVVVRGVAATVGCPTACRITGRLRIDEDTARGLGLRRRALTIARASRSLSGDRSTPRLRLKPSRRVLRRLRRLGQPVTARVTLEVQAEGYERRTYAQQVTITR